VRLGAWRAFLFKYGRNGRGLAYVYTGAGAACLAPGLRLPACLPGGPAVGPGGAARAACLPIPLPIRQPPSRNGWQIPGSNFGFRF